MRQNKVLKIKKKTFIAGIFIMGVLLSSLFISIANQQAEEYVKVLSIFGCMPLAETPQQFEAKREFRRDILNHQLVRCYEDGEMYTRPIGPTKQPPYKLDSELIGRSN